ncbi:MAG: phage major tail tube protein [Fusobacterium sp.]|nr:phage major tail tube protein [Fusobacterium sp.]
MAFRSEVIEEAIVRINGTNELVGIANVSLPDITHKKETIEGLGVIKHSTPIPTNFDEMSLKIKFINRYDGISLGKNNINLTITAAITGVDTDTHEYADQKAVYSIKGKITKTSGGELGKGVKNETELEIDLTYFKEEINGKIIYEIDVYNKKVIVNGIDYYGRLNGLLA